MSKLPRFRDWVPLDEAAQYLKLSELALLDRALDRRLTLSVNFKTPAEGLRGKCVPLGQAQLVPYPPRLAKRAKRAKKQAKDAQKKRIKKKRIEGIPITDDTVLEVVDWETVTIDGVWDLPMVGSERLAVERRVRDGGRPRLETRVLDDTPLVYRVEVFFGYEAVTPSYVYNGAFLSREDGTCWCRLHRWRRISGYNAGVGVFRREQHAIHGTAPEWISTAPPTAIPSPTGPVIRDDKPYVPPVLQCLPVFELPDDIDLVVRTAVLKELAPRMLTVPDKDPPTRPDVEPTEARPQPERAAPPPGAPAKTGADDPVFDISTQDLDTIPGRRTTIDAFLEACNRTQSCVIRRTHIWRAIGHTKGRGFRGLAGGAQ